MYLDTKEFIKEFPLLEYYICYGFCSSQNQALSIQLLTFRFLIVNNLFIDIDIKKKLITYQNRIVRTNYIENKFFNKWIRFLLNKKKAINTFDLEFNKIEETSKNINFIDFRNKKRYVFTQKDFKNVIQNSLFYSWNYDYTPDPLPIRNPYDNHTFTKTELLELDKQINDPPLIWKLFKDSNYCIETLKITYNYYLLKNCINSYIANLENEDIIYYLESILLFFKNRANQNSNSNNNISYKDICKKCFENQSFYRQKNVKDILYRWIQYLKFKIPFTNDNYIRLLKVFKNPCVIHTRIIKKKNRYRNIVQSIGKSNNLLCDKDIFVFTANKDKSVDDITITKEKNLKHTKYSLWYKNKNKNKNVDIFSNTTNIFLPKSNCIHLELFEAEDMIRVRLSEKILNGYSFIKTIE